MSERKLNLENLGFIMVKRLTRTIPPLRGPNPQGLNVPLKQVKIVKLEKLNGKIKKKQGKSILKKNEY